MKKVLITAPLRQEVKIFLEYQKSLDNLIIPDGVEVDRFFVVNDCPEIIPFIKGRYTVINSGDEFIKNEKQHVWAWANIIKMPILRNRTIEEAKKYDYWFSVDTDLILHPLTLKTLIEADKDIISEVFFTDNWCNAWMYDQCDMDGKINQWKQAGLYRVGMTGACTLVKTEVFEHVDYTPIPNIRYSLVGEDRHFSIRAACAGFEMWLDTHYPAEHLYTEEAYQNYMRKKR